MEVIKKFKGIGLYLSLVWLIYGICGGNSKALVNPIHHELFSLTKDNFGHRLIAGRDKQLFVVLFYSLSKPLKRPSWLEQGNNADTPFPQTYEDLIKDFLNPAAIQLKKMVQIGVIDCDKNNLICKNELNHEEYPVLRYYPLNPVAPYDYKGPYVTDDLVKWVRMNIPATEVTMLTNENFDKFRKNNMAIPKCILFTNKQGIPSDIRGLSIQFKNRILFGVVNVETSEKLAKQFKVTQTPKVVVLRTDAEHQSWFPGESAPDYKSLYEWLNPMAETFVMHGGMPDSHKGTMGNTDQPWSNERIPELTSKSNKKLCFDTSGSGKNCGIFLVDKEELTDSDYEIIEKIAQTYDNPSKVKKYKWTWMNVKAYKEWDDLFGERKYPSFAITMTKPRLRYSTMDADQVATYESINSFLKNHEGGWGRSINVKEGKLPSFSKEKQQDKKRNNEEL